MSDSLNTKIKINNEIYDLSERTLQLDLSAVVCLKDTLINDNRHFSRDVIEIIKEQIVRDVSEKYVQDFSDEIIKKVDLESIVKRVQLRIVERLK